MLRTLLRHLYSLWAEDHSTRAWSSGLFSVVLVTLAVPSTSDVGEWIGVAEGGWAYVVVFVVAAIPWWEVLLVVPPSIGLGLNPVAVAISAFLGNMLPIYGIIALHGRVTTWLERRRERTDSKGKRSKRANKLYTRYGLPGVALVAPVAIGVHLATVIVLVLGAPPRDVVLWMTVSVAIWTVALTVSSVVGFGLLGLI